jgi:hypothetical protein
MLLSESGQAPCHQGRPVGAPSSLVGFSLRDLTYSSQELEIGVRFLTLRHEESELSPTSPSSRTFILSHDRQTEIPAGSYEIPFSRTHAEMSADQIQFNEK